MKRRQGFLSFAGACFPGVSPNNRTARCGKLSRRRPNVFKNKVEVEFARQHFQPAGSVWQTGVDSPKIPGIIGA